MRIDVEEEQLVRLQPRLDALDGAAAAQAAQLPHQVRLGGDVEHHLGAAQAAHHAARQRLVAEDLARFGDDDRVIVDVDGAIAQARPQVRDATRPLAFLDRSRRVRRLANAAIDQPLETDLRIVVDVRPSDVDVEQRGDVLAVLRLDSAADVALEPRHHLRDLVSVAAATPAAGTWKKMKSSSLVKLTIRRDVLSAVSSRNSRTAAAVVSSTASSFSHP